MRGEREPGRFWQAGSNLADRDDVNNLYQLAMIEGELERITVLMRDDRVDLGERRGDTT